MNEKVTDASMEDALKKQNEFVAKTDGNLEEAQVEYDRMIRERTHQNVITSSGGVHSVSSSSFSINTSTGSGLNNVYRIENLGNAIIRTGATTVYDMSGLRQEENGRVIQTTAEVASLVGIAAIEKARQIVDTPLRTKMLMEYDTLDPHMALSSIKADKLMPVNTVIEKYSSEYNIPILNGMSYEVRQESEKQLNRLLKMQRDGDAVPQDLIAALTEAKTFQSTSDVLRKYGIQTPNGRGSQLQVEAAESLLKLYANKKHGQWAERELKKLKEAQMSGSPIHMEDLNFLKSIKNAGQIIPQDLIDALKEVDNIGTMSTFHGHTRGFQRSKFIIRNNLMRYLRRDDTGTGLYITGTIVSRSKQIIRGSIRSAWNMTNSARNIMSKALIDASKKINRSSELMSSVILQMEGKGKLEQAAALRARLQNPSKIGKKIHSGIEKGSEMLDATGKIIGRNNPISKFLKDPFHLKTKLLNKARKTITNALAGTKLGTALAKASELFATIMAKLSAVTEGIKAAILSILPYAAIVIFILILVLLVVMVVVTSYDLTASNTDKATEKLMECYVRDMRSIMDECEGYSLVYDDVKDDDAYEKIASDAEINYVFYETTNCAEILSMAYVYFGYTLEDNDDEASGIESASRERVVDFVEDYYNGSHEIIADTYTRQVTYRTYYFNSLFSRKKMNSPPKIQWQTGSSVNNSVLTAWRYLTNRGFTPESTAAILGNIRQESNWDMGALSSDGAGSYGLCQWTDARLESLKTFAENDPDRDINDITLQLDFLLSELEGCLINYSGPNNFGYYNNGVKWGWETNVSLNDFVNLTDISKATEIFERCFERASIPMMEKRIQYANAYYNTYKNLGDSPVCVYFRQGDYNTPADIYSIGNISHSISYWGCGLTCFSSVLASYTGDTSITPRTVVQYINTHGMDGAAQPIFRTMTAEYPILKYEEIGNAELSSDFSKARNYLLEGKYIIIYLEGNNCSNPTLNTSGSPRYETYSIGSGTVTNEEHFVVLLGYDDNGNINVMDPAVGKNDMTRSLSESTIQNYLRQGGRTSFVFSYADQ